MSVAAVDGSPSRGEVTRAAILAAAIERFGRDGYRATSVADIARDAGVGGTVAYAYFKNKEALFLAALDLDASAVIEEVLSNVLHELDLNQWRSQLMTSLAESVDHHPLARRLLGGLEPEVSERVINLPALAELRRVCTELLAREQATGKVRRDIDPAAIANGVVALTMSMLMSVVQLGAPVLVHVDDVAAVLRAAIEPPDTSG